MFFTSLFLLFKREGSEEEFHPAFMHKERFSLVVGVYLEQTSPLFVFLLYRLGQTLSFSFPSDSTYAYAPDSVVFFRLGRLLLSIPSTVW